jgi:serine phosphatase RsbU (regulator of sigma subunit)
MSCHRIARFATTLYAVLSPDGRLTYCNAGHNPPFLLQRTGITQLSKGGMVLDGRHVSIERGVAVHDSFRRVVRFHGGDVCDVFVE